MIILILCYYVFIIKIYIIHNRIICGILLTKNEKRSPHDESVFHLKHSEVFIVLATVTISLLLPS